MKNLITRTALCGVMLVGPVSKPAPESYQVSVSVPYELSITDLSIANNPYWINDMYAQKYPAPVWPPLADETLPAAKSKGGVLAKPEAGISKQALSFDTFNDLIAGDMEYSELYEQAISFIKFHEGFCPSVYKCVAGYPTIGYGHVVRPGDKFPERISRDFADRMLRRDFDKSIKTALKYSPQLTGHKLIAVAHFCFAKGPGRYKKSRLRRIIESGGDPSAEFMKWCKYHTPEGVLVTSSYCRKIREWEVRMYNAGLSADGADSQSPPVSEQPVEILDTIPHIYISEI